MSADPPSFVDVDAALCATLAAAEHNVTVLVLERPPQEVCHANRQGTESYSVTSAG